MPSVQSNSSVIIIGGGVAGLSAAAALGSTGTAVQLFETRAFLGGRATSYDYNGEAIDNCQHILLHCCVNLQDFYTRLGVAGQVEFHRKFYFIEPGGRTSILKAGILPVPAHFAGSFLKASYLNVADKLSLASGLMALKREYKTRKDLDQISMWDWLHEKRQTPGALLYFWRQVLVSAINEELPHMSAAHGFQVIWLGFLTKRNSYRMGIPTVPLAELYSEPRWRQFSNVQLRTRQQVERILVANGRVEGVQVAGEIHRADHYISAVPFDRINALIPEAQVDVTAFSHVPITGIHLWFDRPVTNLPHATLLDRTIHWMYNKRDGRYLQLVVSASRTLTPMSRADVIALALRELAEYFPLVAEAKLEHAHVVKEMKATFSAAPGLELKRPLTQTKLPNFFLAGDWTRSGWPATMEGAVRSGYKAAEAVTAAQGRPSEFLLPDLA